MFQTSVTTAVTAAAATARPWPRATPTSCVLLHTDVWSLSLNITSTSATLANFYHVQCCCNSRFIPVAPTSHLCNKSHVFRGFCSFMTSLHVSLSAPFERIIKWWQQLRYNKIKLLWSLFANIAAYNFVAVMTPSCCDDISFMLKFQKKRTFFCTNPDKMLQCLQVAALNFM